MALDVSKKRENDTNVRNILTDFSYDQPTIEEVIDAVLPNETLENIPTLSSTVTQNAKFLYTILKIWKTNNEEEIHEYLTSVGKERLYKNKIDLDTYLNTARKKVYFSALDLADGEVNEEGIFEETKKAISSYNSIAGDMRKISEEIDTILEPELQSGHLRIQILVAQKNAHEANVSYLQKIYQACPRLTKKSRQALYSFFDATKWVIQQKNWENFTFTIESHIIHEIISNIKTWHTKHNNHTVKSLIMKIYKNMAHDSTNSPSANTAAYLEESDLKDLTQCYRKFIALAYEDYKDHEKHKDKPSFLDNITTYLE